MDYYGNKQYLVLKRIMQRLLQHKVSFKQLYSDKGMSSFLGKGGIVDYLGTACANTAALPLFEVSVEVSGGACRVEVT